LSDMETGYKAFRVDVLRSLRLSEDGFGIEAELTGEVCNRGLRIYQLPIAYYGRTYAEGKKITWRDGFKAVRVLFEVRLRRTAPRASRARPRQGRSRRELGVSGGEQLGDGRVGARLELTRIAAARPPANFRPRTNLSFCRDFYLFPKQRTAMDDPRGKSVLFSNP